MFGNQIGGARGIVRLSERSTRRKFLKYSLASSAGLAGFRKATEKVTGEKPDGVPIVWRRDKHGDPETLRYVPKERYRRLMVYKNLDIGHLTNKSGKVNGISTVQRSSDPANLGLKVYVDTNDQSVRRALPNRIQKIPLEVEERQLHLTPGVCNKFAGQYWDPLLANVEVEGDPFNGTGTLGVVAFNSNQNNPFLSLLTAAHVVDNGDSDYLAHLGTRAGSYVTHSPLSGGLDVAKYRLLSSNIDAGSAGTASDELPVMAGSWDFVGLEDYTTDNELYVEFAGRTTCYAEASCTDTNKGLNTQLTYSAKIEPNEVEHGDSGGPFLDGDGFLVCTFSQFNEPNEYSVGGTGTEVLNSMNVQLADPRLG